MKKKHHRCRLFKSEKLPNLSLKMKLTTLLLIISLFKIHANTYSQNKKITLDLKNATIEEVFQSIEERSEFSFLYNQSKIDINRKVSLNVHKKTISDILDSLFSSTDIYFKVKKKQIILKKGKPKEKIMPATTNVIQETITVTGTVTEAGSGMPVPAANILEVGTTNGVMSDFDGNYSIEVSEGATLKVSYIGYATQEVEVNGSNEIDIALEQDAAALDEVVVVGYGTQSRANITGALSSVKAEDIVTEGAGTVEKSLQGRIPGVQVESAGGNPGSGVRILIRGTGSFGNNAPLYIVDGVQVENINNLAPGDIASMDILKDASAAAIYGSRAANGVVLITTKTGEKGENRLNLSAYYGVQKISDKLDVLNAKEWAIVSNAAHDNANLARLEIAEEALNNGKGTDWQDEIYRVAPMQNYNLSASGGGENLTYSISGSYLDQEGIVEETGYDRWNLRLKSTFSKGRLKIGETVILSKENWQNISDGFGGQGGNPVGSAPKMIPAFSVYNENAVGGYGGAYGPVVDVASPVAHLNLENNESQAKKVIINAFAEFSILDELTYKLNTGYTSVSRHDYIYTYPYEVGSHFRNLDSDLYESRGETVNKLMEHTLSYNQKFGDHKIEGLLGYSYQNNEYRGLTGSKSGMPPGVMVLDGGTTNIASGSNAWESALISYFGRVVYSFDDKYMVTGIIRRDGSSRFGSGNKYGNFPSIALGWNFSNEDFFNSEVINLAKFRTSYGVLGNQEFADYRFNPAIDLNTNYVMGSGQQLWPGAIQTAFATPDIKWETSKTLNFGLDLSMLDHKLDFTADYFIKKNTDVLLQVPIPLSTGASGDSPFINAGEITNKGFEAVLSYGNVVKDFEYQVTGTFSSVDNEVNQLGTGSQQIFGGQPTHHGASATVTQAGLPVGAFYLIETDGIFNSQSEIDAHSVNGDPIQPNAKPGDIRFKDMNNDGQIDQNDRKYVGSPNPDFSFGLGGNFRWKNFDLNLFFQGTSGNKIYNGLRQDLEGMNLEYNYAKSTLNAWTPENTETSIPRAVIDDPNQNARTSDRFLEDGSYLRLKTLQIGYNISSSFLESIEVQNARIYASADNIFTLTNYSGYNPDIGRGGSVLDRGVDFGHIAYPLSRTLMIGMDITF
ncbi:TonB-linked outer membrane protein, SusC/RagA family [Salegentibacter echinorum]|uniref:TonB-linked outer membrane protein, SusC/RagA family n=1 Tax=Salegentibacter echinorum TaxID=1073325 RepID=A0A1M5GFX4_SALEC|nr:TonB-dependent receptor [Salegentibacter echinorum]SHG02617.1 TonB-linked outer membrane protein, SusC/RagA family [Salegentibacter echinorum]